MSSFFPEDMKKSFMLKGGMRSNGKQREVTSM